METHPIFLGITLDKYLTFNKHFSRLIKKSQNRLNIIKILSNKSWPLNQKILFNIYKSLIGSIFDYSFFCSPCLCHTRTEKIQVIQNTAIRNILKLKYDTPSEILRHSSKPYIIIPIKERAYELNNKYIIRTIEVSNPLIVQLISEFQNGFAIREIKKPTPLCASKMILEDFFSGTDIFNGDI